jgi:hypothetical protein
MKLNRKAPSTEKQASGERQRLANSYVPVQRSALHSWAKAQQDLVRILRKPTGKWFPLVVFSLVAFFLLWSIPLGLICVAAWVAPKHLDKYITNKVRTERLATAQQTLGQIPDDVLLNWIKHWKSVGGVEPYEVPPGRSEMGSPLIIPKILDYKETPEGFALRCEYPAGVLPDSAQMVLKKLISHWRIENIQLKTSTKDPRIAFFLFTLQDPIESLPAEMHYRNIDKLYPCKDLRDGIELGTLVNGSVAKHYFHRSPHMLIAGNTGAGKSSLLVLILCEVLRCYHTRLWLGDGKEGVELGTFAAQAERFEVVPDRILGMLLDAEQLMQNRYANLLGMQTTLRRRNAALKQQMEANGTTPKVGDFEDDLDSLPITADDPAILVVLDELAQVWHNLSDEKDEDGTSPRLKAENALKSLKRLGRGCNIFVIGATQNPTADMAKGTGWRANFTTAIGGRVRSQDEERIIFGAAVPEKYKLANFSSHAGLRLSKDSDGDWTVFVADYINKSERAYVAAMFPSFERPTKTRSEPEPEPTQRPKETVYRTSVADEAGVKVVKLKDGSYGTGIENPEDLAVTDDTLGAPSDSRSGCKVPTANLAAEVPNSELPIEGGSGPLAGAPSPPAKREPLVSPRLREVFGILCSASEMSTGEVAEQMGASRETARKYLTDLESIGYVKGDGKGRWWPILG